MPKQYDDQPGKDAKQRRPRFLRILLVWTVLALIAFLFVHFRADWLNENSNIQPGITNIIKVLLIVGTFLLWWSWFTCFSRVPLRLLWSLAILGLIALFFYQFRLIFDGDLGFVRMEQRFAARELETGPSEAVNSAVDLSITSDADFPQFLGGNRNAIINNRELNGDWQQHPPKLLWKQPIGEGWSGFVAVNGFAVTQEQRGQDECVTCYDVESGELIWIHSRPNRHEDTMSLGKAGPRATPTIHQGRVYAQGATGLLLCLDGSNGDEIWSVDLTELLGIELESRNSSKGFTYDYEDSPLAWGRSGSPMIFEDKAIVTGGGPRGGPFVTLIAFDRKDGREIWRGGDRMIAYGSPSAAKLLGKWQLTLVAESAAMGFDPDDGRVLWSVEREGNSDAAANCSQVTTVSGSRVLLTKGYQLGGEMVQLNRSAGDIAASTIWKNPRVLKTKMMSPVILDGYAYSLSDGYLECSDLTSDEAEGRRVWRKRKRFGNGQLLLVGQHLLVHTEDGRLKLVEATPDEYRELGEIETIDGVCWNTLCLFDRFLLVRSELEAACYELTLVNRETDEATAVSEPAEEANSPAVVDE